ncbi:MAG: DUF861 domain-containing protein [Desulfovibrionaceae bacterium]|jgi:ethanolamine utilization protein EutQ|nr:DUF861 domain-containing protein [Desulfovibrionaceae bacterium]
MAKRIIAESDIIKVSEEGGRSIAAPAKECLVTPKARDKAAELGVTIVGDPGAEPPAQAAAEAPGRASATVTAAPVAAVAAARRPSGATADAVIGEVIARMRPRLSADVRPAQLADMVRAALSARIAGRAAPAQAAAAAAVPAAPAPASGGARTTVEGVCFIDNARLMRTEEGPTPVPGSVIMAEALGGPDETRLSGGYMQWEKASFSRTVECAEVCVVVDGKLHLTVGGETLIGSPGDMIYLPEGAHVLYSAPDKVRLACVNCVA